MSTSPTGMQAMVSYIDKSNIFVQQTSRGSNQYIVYNKSFKHKVKKAFECGIIDDFKTTLGKTNMSKIDEGGANNQTLQRFRIAVSVTGEYTQYFGGTIAGALAGINATLTRVNEVFENDMGVTFELVDATELIYTNSTTDPYSDADIGADPDNSGSLDGWSLQLQNNLTSTIGNSADEIVIFFQPVSI